MPFNSKHRRPVLILTGLAVVVYVILATAQLNLPGPNYDEVLHAPAAVALVTGSTDHFGMGFNVGRYFVPVMTSEYVGAFRSYLLLPLFLALGPGVVPFRLTMILVTAIGLIFTLRFAREFLGDIPALAGMWLLATDATFILATRGDWGPVAAAFAIRMAGLYAAWCWWKGRGKNVASLFVAALLAGLGTWNKANFLWFVIATVAVGTCSWLIARDRPVINRRSLAAASTGWLIGVAPLLGYNLLRDWITFKLAAPPGQQASLTRLMALVRPRLIDLLATFDPSVLSHWMSGIRSSGGIRDLVLPLSFLSVVVLSVVAIRYRRPSLMFLPALMMVMLIQMFATPRHIWIHHYFALYPFPHLTVGLLLGVSFDDFRDRMKGLLGWSLAIIIVGTIVVNLTAIYRFHENLRLAGGSSMWTDAVYELSRDLETNLKERKIQVLDWGIYNQLYLLNSRRLRLFEPIYSMDTQAKAVAVATALLADRENVFVVHSADSVVMPAVEKGLMDAATQEGIQLRQVMAVSDRRGVEIFRVLQR